jgi:hypothetical protein
MRKLRGTGIDFPAEFPMDLDPELSLELRKGK